MPVTSASSSDQLKLQTSQESSSVDKVTQYEHFLNEVLRTDLKDTLERRDQVYAQAAQYMELQTVIEKLSSVTNGDETTRLKTKVDLGSNFYVQAEIPNTKTFTVDLGCGIWLPMSSKDAIGFCTKKLDYLNAKIDELTKRELNLKAQIGLVLEGLKEIQNIQFVEPRPRYEF